MLLHQVRTLSWILIHFLCSEMKNWSFWHQMANSYMCFWFKIWICKASYLNHKFIKSRKFVLHNIESKNAKVHHFLSIYTNMIILKTKIFLQFYFWINICDTHKLSIWKIDLCISLEVSICISLLLLSVVHHSKILHNKS